MNWRVILLSVACTGCWGYSSLDNEAVCQPKKLHHNTPLICADYDTIDVSMGVMRNGVGSMSTEDIEMAFDPRNQAANEELLKQAIDKGKLVRLRYNDRRFSWCQEMKQVTSVSIVEP